MKLCLDEHYHPNIAEQLRDVGHDVCSVKERADLLGLNDLELWGRLIAEHRALLTENVADFVPLARQAAEMGQSHYGLVFSSSRSMPRSRGTIGLFVERLDLLMRERAEEDSMLDQTQWLSPS